MDAFHLHLYYTPSSATSISAMTTFKSQLSSQFGVDEEVLCADTDGHEQPHDEVKFWMLFSSQKIYNSSFSLDVLVGRP